MKLRILGNRLHVKPVPPLDVSVGGIFIPAQVQDQNRFGGPKLWDVLDVGTGRTICKNGFQISVPVEAQPGDRVITFSYTSGALHLDDGTAIVDQGDVLVIIPKNNRYETMETTQS